MRTDHRSHRGAHLATAVGPDHDVLREHLEQSREVSARARHEETIGQLSSVLQIAVETLPSHLDALASPRRELTAGWHRPPSERATSSNV